MAHQPIARLIPAQDNTNTETTQTSMPRVESEPFIQVSEWANKLYRAATVIGT
jgi:hypothetical protein